MSMTSHKENLIGVKKHEENLYGNIMKSYKYQKAWNLTSKSRGDPKSMKYHYQIM